MAESSENTQETGYQEPTIFNKKGLYWALGGLAVSVAITAIAYAAGWGSGAETAATSAASGPATSTLEGAATYFSALTGAIVAGATAIAGIIGGIIGKGDMERNNELASGRVRVPGTERDLTVEVGMTGPEQEKGKAVDAPYTGTATPAETARLNEQMRTDQVARFVAALQAKQAEAAAAQATSKSVA